MMKKSGSCFRVERGYDQKELSNSDGVHASRDQSPSSSSCSLVGGRGKLSLGGSMLQKRSTIRSGGEMARDSHSEMGTEAKI